MEKRFVNQIKYKREIDGDEIEVTKLINDEVESVKRFNKLKHPVYIKKIMGWDSYKETYNEYYEDNQSIKQIIKFTKMGNRVTEVVTDINKDGLVTHKEYYVNLVKVTEFNSEIEKINDNITKLTQRNIKTGSIYCIKTYTNIGNMKVVQCEMFFNKNGTPGYTNYDIEFTNSDDSIETIKTIGSTDVHKSHRFMNKTISYNYKLESRTIYNYNDKEDIERRVLRKTNQQYQNKHMYINKYDEDGNLSEQKETIIKSKYIKFSKDLIYITLGHFIPILDNDNKIINISGELYDRLKCEIDEIAQLELHDYIKQFFDDNTDKKLSHNEINMFVEEINKILMK